MSHAHRRLLLVWHSRTGLAKQMADSLERGALSAAHEMGVGPSHFSLLRRRAADATIEDVLEADGFLFCAPENLASTSGEMLEFFHRSYYPIFDDAEISRLAGRPYGLAVAAGSDGSSAARQMARICTGWRLRAVVPDALIVHNGQPQTAAAIALPKSLPAGAEERCAELGGIVAATLLLSE